MKKFLGIFLSLMLTVSVLSGIDLMVMSSSAKAMNNSGGNGTPTPAPSTEKTNVSVSTELNDKVPGEPDADQSAGNGGINGDKNYIPPAPAPAPAPPTASCQTYNGSYSYPVEGSSAPCDGVINKTGGGTFNFTCPSSYDANGEPVSAIYVTYDETISYEVKGWSYRYDAPEFAWGLIGGNLENYWGSAPIIGGTIAVSRGEDWTVLSASATAYSRLSEVFPWPVGRDVQVSGWFTNQAKYNTWKNEHKFNYYGEVKAVLQSRTPTVAINNVSCKYPLKPKVQPLYSVVCLLYYDSSFYQSQSKDGIRYGGSLLDTRNGLRAGQTADINQGIGNNYGVTVANHWNCNSDTLQTTETYSVASPETGGYGYYRLSAAVYATRCYVEGYPTWAQNHTKDRITGCTTPYLYNTYNSYAVYSCSGFVSTGQGSGAWAALPNGVNFAVSACEVFGCTVSGSLQIGDTSSPLQVMRNGENINVTYPSITVQASGNSRQANGATTWEEVTEAASGVVDGSSPFYGSTTNASKQYFELRNAADKATSFVNARSGDAVNANNSNPSSAWQPMLLSGVANPNYSKGFVRFNWASNNGQNWKMFRTFRVHGEFFVPIAGGSDGSTSMGWQKETKYCGNVISNPVTVVRSVNDLQ